MNAEAKKKTWYSVAVTADAEAEAAVETAFGILDSDGIENDLLGNTCATECSIVGYFESEPDRSHIEGVIGESLKNFGLEKDLVKEIKVETVPERDWLAEWKRHWKATKTGSFVISPPWEKPVTDSGDVVIYIDPSMAFGTGTHETTRLCLLLIEEHFQNSRSFLDVGTGTGILSIAAAKLASDARDTKFKACDTDKESVAIALENAVLNGVPHIDFEHGSIGPQTPEFEFVCANLTLDVIVHLLPLLISKTKRVLVVSGILAEQEKTLRRKLTGLGFDSPEILVEGEWIAAAILKR